MAFDPWYKTTLPLQALGANLQMQIPHDVFSTIRIDEGTLLLLDHLPSSNPKSILDMGCGYGALGLPVAAHYPDASIEMVDRDLLAVAWSTKNAESNQLKNAHPYPSLGYRDLATTRRPYDWILCNVPARIGRPFIEHLFEAGLSLLAAQGEIRVVVIRDLGATVEAIRTERSWPIEEIARGPRHTIYALKKMPMSEINLGGVVEPEGLYARDQVSIGGADGIRLERPFDISGDSARLVSAIPMLIDVLPRKAPQRVLSFRCAYGAVPLFGRKRWPTARIVAFDRDLLATSFTRDNARRLDLGGELLDLREGVDLTHALHDDDRFDLAAGELSSSAGLAVAEADLLAIASHLDRQGQALILTIEKLERDWVTPIAARRRLSITRLISRDGNVVLRLSV